MDHQSSSRSDEWTIDQRGALVTPQRRTPLGKAEDKRAAIIAEQAARQQAEHPNAAPLPKRKTNWAATPPLRPRRGRPLGGGVRG
jgi:hypothetical protein